MLSRNVKKNFVVKLADKHGGSVLQIRRGKRDNFGIGFHIIPLKHTLKPIINPSR